jgi:hypothetical protein
MIVRGKHEFDKQPTVNGNNIVAIKETTVAPTVNDDNTAGYYVGYKWVDTTTDTTYHCEDATTGAAVWSSGGGGSGMATDTLWDTAGDMAYATGADTGAKLPIGTANQKLKVNSGATAPEWVTEIKTIQPIASASLTEGTALSGPFAETITDGITTGIDLLNRIYYSLSGNNLSSYQQRMFVMPEDFASWNEITLDIYGQTDSEFRIYIAEQDDTGAADTANIIFTGALKNPAAANTWERVTWNPTGSYTPGKIYAFVVYAATVGNDTLRFEFNAKMKYNAK